MVRGVQSELTAQGSGPSDQTVRSLGDRIRDARLAKGLGVRELARNADCSASLVSQIERGRANPSVSTLYSLADALGISVASLFGDGEENAVAGGPRATEESEVTDARAHHGASSVGSIATLREQPTDAPRMTIEDTVVLRRGKRRSINLERGVHWELLLPRSEREVDFLEVRYDPRGGSALEEHAIRHHGREMAVIIEGVLSAQIGFERYDLHHGDSLSFASTIPHRYWNGGETEARAIFVVLGGWDR
jgi:transcriptional regulator with XRE-family HTH domain